MVDICAKIHSNESGAGELKTDKGKKEMKKILSFLIVGGVLVGCSSYNYYKGNVRYVQDGDNCIYYTSERAKHYSDAVERFNDDNRIIYSNTRCEDLFARDNAGRTERNGRRVLVPASVANRKPKPAPKPVVAPKPVEKPCCECTSAELVPVSRQFFALTEK